MNRVKILAACCSLVVLSLLASCSSDTNKPKTFTVEIKDMKFVPETVTVAKGDTVIWINKDMVTHDITEEASKTWSSGPLKSDSSWKMAVTDESDYYCSIHTVMKGHIEIQ